MSALASLTWLSLKLNFRNRMGHSIWLSVFR